MSNFPITYGSQGTYNGEDCLIIPLKDIVEAQVEYRYNAQRPTVRLTYYPPSIIGTDYGG